MKRLILFALAFSTPALAEVRPAPRIVLIDDVIAPSNAGVVADALYALSQQNKEPVTVLIDTVGGSVSAGFEILNAFAVAQARGVKLQCLVINQAISMGFWIYLHCDQRAALPHAQFLWHRIRIFSPPMIITGPGALEMAVSLLRADEALMADLFRFLPMEHAEILAHLEAESLLPAQYLISKAPQFLVITTKIPDFDIKTAPRLSIIRKDGEARNITTSYDSDPHPTGRQ